VDPLFESAARLYGNRAIGVILSGGLDDGTVGLQAIKKNGGLAVVQDPEEAVHPSMPLSALRGVDVDHVASSSQISELLVKLVRRAPARRSRQQAAGKREMAKQSMSKHGERGAPTDLVCPECGGSLREISKDDVVRFRCHVGHSYTGDSLVTEQTNTLEQILWTAVRALEDQATLKRRVARWATERNAASLVERYEHEAEDADRRSRMIRDVLTAENGAIGLRADRGSAAPSRPRKHRRQRAGK
jgi:two-component system chemotaxis response regulator CheB